MLTPAWRANNPTSPVPRHGVPSSLSSCSPPSSWPYQTPNILYNGYFSACLPHMNRVGAEHSLGSGIAGVWWGWGLARTPQLTCCCDSRQCGGHSCGRSRRGGSRRHRGPSSRGGSGRSGAPPRRACRGSRQCWGRRRCEGPGGVQLIPAGGRNRLWRHRGGREHLWVQKLCGMKVQQMLLCLGTITFLRFFFLFSL